MADVKQREIREQLREMSVPDLHNEIAAQRATLFQPAPPQRDEAAGKYGGDSHRPQADRPRHDDPART